MTVRLIVYSWITAYVLSGHGAVIFASWSHAFHAYTQDCKKSHTVKTLQSGQKW